MKTIGEQIEEYRRAHKDAAGKPMSITAFAALVSKEMPRGEKVSRQNIAGLIENRVREPRDSVRLKAIAAVLGKTLNELLEGVPAGSLRVAPAPTPIADAHRDPVGEALKVLGEELMRQTPQRRKAAGQLLALFAEDPSANRDAEDALLALLGPGASTSKRQSA